MPSNPADLIQRLKDQGHRVIGCLPLYPPVELFHSLGLTPVTLWGRPLSDLALDSSFRHLQTYACSVAHRLTEFLLTEPGRLFDGVFGYNACDTLRNLREILQQATGNQIPFFGFHLPQPPRDQTDSAAYFKSELAALIDRLEESFQVRFSEESFNNSVELYRKARELTRRLETHLPFSRFAELVEDSHFLPVEEQIELFGKQLESPPAREGCPIIVSGIQVPAGEVASLLEDSGLQVVGNDVASLARSYGHTPDNFRSVFDYYRDFYDNHLPCTTLLYSADRRIPFLADMLNSSGAKGFVFLGEKFCEHEYFEIPALERLLKERGVQVLTLEFSLDDERMAESVRTRIEAFAEITTG